MSLTSCKQFARDELTDHHFAQAFDVHRAATGEMFEPPAELRGTLRIHATHRDLAFVFLHRAAAFRTLRAAF